LLLDRVAALVGVQEVGLLREVAVALLLEGVEVVRTLLGRGTGCGCAVAAGVCREPLAVEPALYTFARAEGVEPTNNGAERALRDAVCWRKTSYGTDSAGGSRFVERVLTVVTSCRQQRKDVLEFLTECARATHEGADPPSLLPPPATAP
jgi:transposase